MVGQGCYNKTKRRVDGRMKNRVLTDNSMRKNQERVMNITQSFYDNMASQYDKLFLDWDASVEEQAVILELERGPV